MFLRTESSQNRSEFQPSSKEGALSLAFPTKDLIVYVSYASGLLFISPLGDLVKRRPLLLLLCSISTSLTVGLSVTRSLVVFKALCFFIGTTSMAPQILIPLAADLAPPSRRASALSIVFSGLLLGILIARVLAGVIAQYATWRVVYYFAIGVQCAVITMLWATIPDYPAKNKDLTYFKILSTMARLAVTEPKLIQASLICMATTACFTCFWVTLTFLLGGPPYHYSTWVVSLYCMAYFVLNPHIKVSLLVCLVSLASPAFLPPPSLGASWTDSCRGMVRSLPLCFSW